MRSPLGQRKKRQKETEPIPCQYDCGRPAAGTLQINYFTFENDAQSYTRGFAVTIPCCRECVKGAIKVAITIPEVAAK